MKLPLQNMKFAFAIALALFGCMPSLAQVQAESAAQEEQGLLPDPVASPDIQPTPSQGSDPIIFTQPEAAKKGAPGRRRGGGSFGGNRCQFVNPPLTALIPGVEETLNQKQEKTSAAIASKSVRGLTASGHPTFWFYVPYSPTSTLFAEFVLINEQNQLVRKDIYQLTETPGIVRIRPSSTSKSPLLEVGKDYHWVFSILCDPNDRSADIYVDGWVQRVALSSNLAAQLRTATPEKRAVIYAQEGLWHEAITTIFKDLRLTQPKKATLLMTNLLQSVGLDGIAQQPIVDCCTSTNN